MQIFIEDKRVVLKQGTTFDYVAENRLFTGSDDYSLTISLPLKGCPQNTAVFGHINRPDVVTDNIVFKCEIRAVGFHKIGAAAITSINEEEVKIQFLEGKSADNFTRTLDDIYINEMKLGYPEITDEKKISPAEAWNPRRKKIFPKEGIEPDEAYYYSAIPQPVALPWVNANSDSGLMHNKAEYVEEYMTGNMIYKWLRDNNTAEGMSWQPYLIDIAMKICEKIDYSCDFSQWMEHEEYKYLLVCNTIPFAWEQRDFAYVLPNWSVQEFFDNLALFLRAEFDFDHGEQRVTMRFSSIVNENTPPVRLENVTEDFDNAVKADAESCEYLYSKNLGYAEDSHEMWKYYSCDWFIKMWKTERQGLLIKELDNLDQLIEDVKGGNRWHPDYHNFPQRDNLYYVKNVDTYFIIIPIDKLEVEGGGTIYKQKIQPLNSFGDRIVNDSDDADKEEIQFVPAYIDYTGDEYGDCLYLEMSSFQEDKKTEDFEDGTMQKLFSNMIKPLLRGEPDKRGEYFDKIYIGWYDGSYPINPGKLPHPHVQNIEISDDWKRHKVLHFSLRLNSDKPFNSPLAAAGHSVNVRQSKTFKFLANAIPDVRAVFHIKGKKYLCEKITATFSESGMSQMLKGVFYPIKD